MIWKWRDWFRVRGDRGLHFQLHLIRKGSAMAQTAKSYDGVLGDMLMAAADKAGYRVKGKTSKKRAGTRAYQAKDRQGKKWEVEIRSLEADARKA